MGELLERPAPGRRKRRSGRSSQSSGRKAASILCLFLGIFGPGRIKHTWSSFPVERGTPEGDLTKEAVGHRRHQQLKGGDWEREDGLPLRPAGHPSCDRPESPSKGHPQSWISPSGPISSR